MIKTLDLTKILKDAPKGLRLWSPIFGDIKFMGFCNNIIYPIFCLYEDASGQYDVLFNAKGEYRYGTLTGIDSKCMLFPSRENHDWSTFHIRPPQHKIFKPFQKVLLKELLNNSKKSVWMATEYSHYNKDTEEHYCTNGYSVKDNDIIPYKGNEDKLGKVEY